MKGKSSRSDKVVASNSISAWMDLHISSSGEDTASSLNEERDKLSDYNKIIGLGIPVLQKIKQLKQIERDYYKPLVKKYAYQKSQEALKKLSLIFADLGDLSEMIADLSISAYEDIEDFHKFLPDKDKPYLEEIYLEVKSKNSPLKYYTDAVMHYRYSMAVIDDQSKEQKIQNIRDKIVQVISQEAIFKTLVIEKNSVYVKELDNLRDYVRQSIEEVDQLDFRTAKYIWQSKVLFHGIALKLKDFVATLFYDAVTEIGAAPCAYSVIGLGSLALEQATPYSDLEFAILTENRDYIFDADPRVRNYFKNLTHFVHFKIINLGETTIPKNRYGIELDHIIKPGIMFDLGGKTALGRIDSDKPYDLIQTVDRMMDYVRNVDRRTEHIDKNLPNILLQTCHIYGDENLTTEYQSNVLEFLHSPAVGDVKQCEVRAIKILQEGAVEVEYGKSSMNKSCGDLSRLRPLDFINSADAGKSFDVKQEIYRVSDRLLYNLGLYFGIVAESVLDILEMLGAEKVILEHSVKNLKYAAVFGIMLRLKTYLHNYGQQEDISLFPRISEKHSFDEEVSNIFHLSKGEMLESSALFEYFFITIPLHKVLDRFVGMNSGLNNESAKAFFIKEEFYTNSFVTKGLIYYRLFKYPEAKTNLERALEELVGFDDLAVRQILANIYINLGYGQEAIKVLEFYHLNYDHSKIQGGTVVKAALLVNLAEAYRIGGDYKNSILYSSDALKIYLGDQSHESTKNIGIVYNNLGLCYRDLKNHEKAIDFFIKSLEIFKTLLGEESKSEVAICYNNLAICYRGQALYIEAINCYKKNLDLYFDIYKGDISPDIASTFNNLGIVYEEIGDYIQSLQYFTIAADMRREIYRDIDHQDIASSLWNFGLIYRSKCMYQESVSYYHKALDMLRRIENVSKTKIANLLDDLGIAYRLFGDYKSAMSYCTEALDMRQKICQEKNTIENNLKISASLSNLANIYENSANYDLATKHIFSALNVLEAIYKGDHPEKATCLGNLGLIFIEKTEFKEAEICFRQALDMRERISYHKPHPQIAEFLNEMGRILLQQGKLEEGFVYLNRSLDMRKEIYAVKSYEVTNSLYAMAMGYKIKGDYKSAENFLQQCLEMRERIYDHQPHIKVAFVLRGLGLVAGLQENFEKAMSFCHRSISMIGEIYHNRDHPDLITPLNDMGVFLRSSSKYVEAENFLMQSLEMCQRVYGDFKNRIVVDSLNDLGICYKMHGKSAEAIMHFMQSLEVCKEIGIVPDPKILSLLAESCSAVGDHHNAVKYSKWAFGIQLERGIEDKILAASLGLLARSYECLESYEEAKRSHIQLIGMYKRIYDSKIDPVIAISLYDLGVIDYRQNRYQDAITSIYKAFKIIDNFSDNPHFDKINHTLDALVDSLSFDLILNKEKIVSLIELCKNKKSDSLDCELYKDLYESCLESHSMQPIDVYLFTIFFIPKEESILKDQMKSELSKLGIDPIIVELWLAIINDDEKSLSDLMPQQNENMDLNAPISFINITPLMHAIINDSKKIVKFLISAEVEVNRSDVDGASALYYSLGYLGYKVDLETAEYLLDHGANPNQTMNNMDTLMHMVHCRGELEAIKLLYNRGVAINIRNNAGETPLDYLLTSDVVADEIKQNIIREFKSEYDPTNLGLYHQFAGILGDITQEIDGSFCETVLLGNGCSE
jgi:tetratricopeptide (TPR) repeat protein